MADTVQEVAYDLAHKAIERQYQALNNTRTRAGTLLAAAALVASFLGTQAFKSTAWGLAVGIVALLVVLAVALFILWPRQFTFRMEANTILEDHGGDAPTDLPDLYAFLAACMDGHHDKNEAILEQLQSAFQLGCVFLAIETVALLTAV